MSEKKPKKQPKFDKRKDPDTQGGDGLEEQSSTDPNFTKTRKQKEKEESEENKNDQEKDSEKE